MFHFGPNASSPFPPSWTENKAIQIRKQRGLREQCPQGPGSQLDPTEFDWSTAEPLRVCSNVISIETFQISAKELPRGWRAAWAGENAGRNSKRDHDWIMSCLLHTILELEIYKYIEEHTANGCMYSQCCCPSCHIFIRIPFSWEPTSTLGGNVSWCSHYGKLYGGSSKN